MNHKLREKIIKAMRTHTPVAFSASKGTFTLNGSEPRPLVRAALEEALEEAVNAKLVFLLTNFDTVVSQILLEHMEDLALAAMGIEFDEWGERKRMRADDKGPTFRAMEQRADLLIKEQFADGSFDAAVSQAIESNKQAFIEHLGNRGNYKVEQALGAIFDTHMKAKLQELEQSFFNDCVAVRTVEKLKQ